MKRFFYHLFDEIDYRITTLFFVLALGLLLLMSGYWIYSLEPRLNIEAKTNANALAHSQAQVLTYSLTPVDNVINVNSVTTAIDEILILTDNSTNLPFVVGIQLSMDYDNIPVEAGKLDLSRGDTACKDCFKTEIALYSRKTHELIGVASFYSSSAFFQRLKREVREKLFIVSAIFLTLIMIVWHTTVLLYKKIRQSEESVRLIFEAAPVPMFIINKNNEMIEKQNLAAEQYLDKLSENSASYDIHGVINDVFNTVNLKEGVSNKEISITSQDAADDRWALLSAYPIEYHDLNAIIVGLTDITKRKQAELELNAIFKRFATVLEYLDARIFVSKIDSNSLLFSNREHGESQLGVKLLEHMRQGERTEDNNLNGILNTEYQDPDTEKWYTCHSRYIKWVDGKTVRLTSAIEISKLKQVQTELEHAKDIAEQATQAKSDFLATMSHEIRTPLNGVLGMLQLLKRTRLSKTQTEYVDAINTSGEILLNLINELLDISKIEANKLELEHELIDLRALLLGISTLSSIRAKEKRLPFTMNASPALPDKIIGDSLRIRQILMNLIGNAIKFTEQGQITLNINLLDKTDDRLHLGFEVTDTGIGIDHGTRDKLFEKFVQADTSISRKYGGTGLGLAITKNLIAAMGGTIEVESEPGQGSSFSFDIYVEAANSTQLDTAQRLEHEPSKVGLKLLIAEDVEINRKVVTGLLQGHNHSITEVTNGLDAVKAVEEQDFDLILMDIHMPGMDGIEASERIRAMADPIKSSIPIIALTANILKQEELRCQAAGINRFIVKPFSAEKLERAIANIRPSANH